LLHRINSNIAADPPLEGEVAARRADGGVAANAMAAAGKYPSASASLRHLPRRGRMSMRAIIE
jgi:hypothetical protein